MSESLETRAQFEKWAKKRFVVIGEPAHVDITFRDSGGLYSEQVGWMWEAWQESRAIAADECAKIADRFNDDCADSIRSQFLSAGGSHAGDRRKAGNVSS